jgi:hypothetical protein
LVALPEAMVSSGHQFVDGSVAFPGATTEKYYSAFRSMVEAELSRPPEAVIEAYSHRVGDKIDFTVWVTNHTEETLWISSNNATVNAIVYEDKHEIVTDRIVRAAVNVNLSPSLAPFETAAFVVETPTLGGVDWNQLHSVVFIDYSFPGGNGAYDIPQAAVPLSPDFLVGPDPIVFLMDPDDSGDQTIPMQLRGPHHLTWSATENLAWMNLSHDSGSPLTPPDLSVIRNQLTEGWQQGTVSFVATSDDGLYFSRQILVKAYLGQVEHVFLSVVTK